MRRVLCLLALLPASCGPEYPEYQTGTWHPVDANTINLRAMVADPEDLQHGAADTRADGQLVAAAIARYRAGKVKALPDVQISKVAPISINNGASAAGGSE